MKQINQNFQRTLLATAVLMAASPAFASELEEVTVVAQKKEERLQDVPIAATAFDAGALEAKQIATVADMRFSAPNVSFTQDNFVGSNFKIRGVGQDVTSAASDAGVGIHVNEVPLLAPRMYQTEYYDVEQVAILRGPQGTLFGRNSTGGAVNMITRRANTDGVEANLEGQYGNYDHKKVKGAVNVPLSDTVAVRLAGIALERDGYTENLFTGNDIDGRDQWSARLSLQWNPGDDTSLNLMVSQFEEDSTRTRSPKQLCSADATGLLGCSPDKLGFDNVNPLAQITGTLPLLLQQLAPVAGAGSIAENPADLRKVNADIDPEFEVDETLAILRFDHDFGDYSLAMTGSYQETSMRSMQDFNMNASTIEWMPSPLLQLVAPIAYETYFADGTLPISAPSENNTGIVGGNIAYANNSMDVYDQSNNDVRQHTFEAHLASNFDGPVNFLAGAFYMDASVSDDYWVHGTGLDYFSVVFPATLGFDGFGWVSPSFRQQTNEYALTSTAAFGELYYDINDELRLTVGARITNDEKSIDDRPNLFNNGPDGNPIFLPYGTDVDWSAASPGRVAEDSWTEGTGRIVLDWAPDLKATDESLFYASFSRGYKGGGFNAPFDPVAYPDFNTLYDPEYVNAYELGSKNKLLSRSLQANFSLFYYDYEDLQVSKIIDRTSFTENTAAEIYGLETELLWAPTDNWLLNANVNYLHTEVKDFASIDPRDPTNGAEGVSLLKDLSTASNCVLMHNGAPNPGVGQVLSCASAAAAGFPDPYTIVPGIEQDLDGNAMANSPELTASLGAEYTWYLDAADLAFRLDYYWQDDMYGRVYNDDIDKIDAWDIWNAQATLTDKSGTWQVRAFARNLADEDHIVGMYVADSSAGLFTNVFTVEPRTFGLALNYNF
ncbi:TonB-dependent receptor [Microbulbifer sp. YPW1]|uniref:TonB-dependent receptor n=1 Tax=Microbulbifer sp. YPW1 TaxID=2745199 RepID=UPI0015972177|nr:TonB-dependent receptor [Microbulbifer sp. YPW1]QKX17198.1 TonB-dependent receptor [Microbulbifer sp. YPW1]